MGNKGKLGIFNPNLVPIMSVPIRMSKFRHIWTNFNKVTSVVTSRGGNGVKQLSQDRIQSFSTLGTTEIATTMNVNCLWGLSNLGQDGVKIPIDSLLSEQKVEADVSSQLVVSAGVSLRQHKLSVAASSIKAMNSIKQRKKQDKVNRQNERSLCKHHSLVISELLKIIPTYPVEEIKTTAFALKQEPKVTETPVAAPVISTNADELTQ